MNKLPLPAAPDPQAMVEGAKLMSDQLGEIWKSMSGLKLPVPTFATLKATT